jgi:hypothetical protein
VIDPTADQRRFSEPSWGSDERQFVVQALVQPLHQVEAAD